ncbi:MAG: bifunctional 2-polyprenyl-6-hydroxyphenol methylase/3-demethylubiquinol 3-O-methyltransferase UbiG [Pseudomonadota bacterium]
MQSNKNSNVDPAEIAKFEAMSMRWWDEEGEFKPLHDMNPTRLGFIEQQVHGLEGKKVLDVGCGGGILSESMAFAGADVTAIDMGEANLSIARMHLLESGAKVDYQLSTVEDMAVNHPGEYDVVTCLEMLEHVPDPAAIIHAASKLIKADGHIILSTVNRNAKAYAFAILGAEYVMNLLPKGTHSYKKFIRPSELDEMIRLAGLSSIKLSGVEYNPFKRSCRLTKNVDINYIFHAQKSPC